jgi:ubiquinone/menaquinone biosynthesis C-methylase UbiE
VGTGLNIPFYPNGVDVTAIDLTPGMLERANHKAQEHNRLVDLRLGDIQQMEFPDGSFDTVVSTCVFCSVPDPRLGLAEVSASHAREARSCSLNINGPDPSGLGELWTCSIP